jgi:hypothetical protein
LPISLNMLFGLVFYAGLNGLQAQSFAATSPTPAVAKKLLFLPFYNQANNVNFAWLETTIGESINDNAKTKYRYVKIDDTVFKRYFKDTGYTSADLYNREKVREIAKNLGADGVIFGEFKPDTSAALSDRASTATEAPGNLIVTGKILSVIDNELVAEKTITMPVSAEMFAAVEEVSQALGENIKNLFFPSDKGAITRSAVLPGWGHMYKQRRTWGYAWGGLFWSSVGFTVLSTVQYVRYSLEYKNYSPVYHRSPGGGTSLRDSDASARFDSLATSIDTWGQMTIFGLVGIGVTYLGNLMHAYFIRPDIVDNPAVLSAHSGAKFNFRLVPVATSLMGMGSNPSRQVRGEISLVWKF